MKPFIVYGVLEKGVLKDFQVAEIPFDPLPPEADIVAYNRVLDGQWYTQECTQTTSKAQDDLVRTLINVTIRRQGGDPSKRGGGFKERPRIGGVDSTMTGGLA